LGLVVGKGYGAVFAFKLVATAITAEKVGKASSVQEEDGLSAFL
jgi:hypothetical protein